MRFKLRHRAAALAATLALPLAGLVALATPAPAATTATAATATYAKTQDWGAGFEGKWTVKNTGTTSISSWTVEWDFPSGTKVTSAWDATVTNSGDHWTAKNLGWNGTLAPGASVSFGSTAAAATAPPSPATRPPRRPAPRPPPTSPTPR
jgi:chitinase